MADIRDMLADVASDSKNAAENRMPSKKRRRSAKTTKRDKNMSRELISLIGNDPSSLVPVEEEDDNSKYKKRRTSDKVKWKWAPFTNSARAKFDKSLQLYHWVRADLEYPEYPFAKFNRKIEDFPKYTDSEYEKCIEPMHKDAEGGPWTREETDRLFALCEQFDLRWDVIADRFSVTNEEAFERLHGKNIPKRERRPVYALKDRFYSAVKSLFRHTGQLQKASRYSYDKEQDKIDTGHLDAVFRQSRDDAYEEKRLRIELKQIDEQLRRLQKEERERLKAMRLADKRDHVALAEQTLLEKSMPVAEGPTIWLPSIRLNRKNYWRSDRLQVRTTASGIGPRLTKKMELVITELGVPEQLMATQRICDAHDKLKQGVLRLLALQKRFHKLLSAKTKAEAA